MNDLQPASVPRLRNQHRFLFAAFMLLCIFNIALPKGGFKLGSVPITWGYTVIGMFAVPALFLLPFRHWPRGPALTQMYFGFLPLSALLLIKLTLWGNFHAENVAYVVNLLVLPFIFLIVYGRYLEQISEERLHRGITWCFRFAVLWGLMNFLLYAVSKKFIEIPYVTVNIADLGDVYDKNNRRGALMKLVSTYNNGNIFGACAVTMAPVYLVLERSRLFRALYVAAIILTLSRTAWFGAGCVFMVMRLAGIIRLGRVSAWVAIVGGIFTVLALMPLMGWTPDRLTDTTLGNRTAQVDDLIITAWGQGSVRVAELVYIGLLQSFGLIGFVFASIALFYPALWGLSRLRTLGRLRRAALVGVVCYLLVALIDGAFSFIPVMAFYLFACILLYRVPPAADAVPAQGATPISAFAPPAD